MDVKHQEKVLKFSIITLGCKTNQSESDDIALKLSTAGMEYDKDFLKADVVIMNTCTVTLASDSKVRQLIRKIKKENPKALLIITGCYAELYLDSIQKEDKTKIFLNDKKSDIPDYILKVLNIKRNLADKRNVMFSNVHTRQLIKIQDGCRQNCAYCIVPFVRGNYISTNPGEIIEKIQLASLYGIEEIVLTGTHIGKFGIDFRNNVGVLTGTENKSMVLDLSQLLKLILDETDIKRIRLSSIEINELSDDLVELMTHNRRIARHLHIPLQSGSDAILRAMGRPYNTDFFSRRLQKIRKLIPEVSFTTDVIVGFPGEKEEDFYKTVYFIGRHLFSKVHVFRFSKRPGTVAEKMQDQVDESIKYFRALMLRNYCNAIRNRYLESFVKKKVSASIEGVDIKKKIATGMSENYIKITVSLDDVKCGKLSRVLKGRIYDILVTGVKGNGLEGVLSN